MRSSFTLVVRCVLSLTLALAALAPGQPPPTQANPTGGPTYQVYVNPILSGDDSTSSITNENGVVYQAADDFFIPDTDEAWEIHQVRAMGKTNISNPPPVTYTVRFYADQSLLPGKLLAEEVVPATAVTVIAEPITGVSADEYQIPINPITFAPGITVWVSVQAHLTSTLGNWFWSIGVPQTGAPAAYINNTVLGCDTWQTGTECGFGYDANPDHRFSLAYLPVLLSDYACRVNWHGRVLLGHQADVLQTAVDTFPNERLKVSGTCAGTQDVAGGRQVLVITQPVTLEGGYDLRWQAQNTPTFIDAQSTGRGMRVLAPASLSHLIVQNGVVSDVTNGAGVLSEAPITLTEVSVLSSTTNYRGGGLALITGTVTGGRIASNTANAEGGGLAIQGHVVVSGTVIEHNVSTDVAGGVFINTTASAVFTNTQVRHNQAAIYGGGFYVRGPLTMHGGTLEANQVSNINRYWPQGVTSEQGGGIFTEAPLWVSGTTFYNNQSGFGGGAVYVFNQPAHFINTLFIGNQANQEGGGLRLEDGAAWFTNTVLARNTAPLGAAAMTVGADSALWLAHVTVANPAPTTLTALHLNGSTAITNSIFSQFAVGALVESGTLSEDFNLFHAVGTPLTGTGLITGANRVLGLPNFANPSLDAYSILSGSAAIDAGQPLGVLTDIVGVTRTLPPDLGAYEFQPLVVLYRLFLPLVQR